MDYQTAKNCFRENLQLLPNPPRAEQDMKAWNLSNGLYYLTESIEVDLSQIKSLLRQLLQEMQQRR